MTCHHRPWIVICDGITGGWEPIPTCCPWCCVKGEVVWGAMREVYSGYCAPDMICGECGHRWSWDQDDPSRHTPDEKREANIAIVASLGPGSEG